MRAACGRSALRLVAIALLLGSSLAPLAAAKAAGATLEVVGRQALGNRGMNAALAVAGHCAWIGSRNDAAVQVVDIANPSAPGVVGSLPAHPGSTPRELRAVPAGHLLVVLYYRLGGTGPNRFEIFHWDADCASSTLVGTWDFGNTLPHEFYLWQDPANARRVLLYTAMFASATQELQVLDITTPARPVLLGGWAVPAAYGHAPVHSVSLAPDGRTAYISLWTGGLVIADVSDFATGVAAPAVRPLTPAGGAYRTPPGNVHSAVPLDGGTRLLTSDERYPAPYGAGCPFGPAHIVDIRDPAHPVAVATLAVPENNPAACASAVRATWTSHNPTLTAHLAFVTWYSAGLQVFQLDDLTQPVRLAELRATGVTPALRDLQLGVTDTMSWSYPILTGGLIYLVDINQGLLVLRYTGPHQDEVASAPFVEGNSNVQEVAVATSPAAASPAPSAAGTPGFGRRVVQTARGTSAGSLLYPVLLILVACGAGVLVTMRRRRS